MLNNKTNHNNTNYSFVKPRMFKHRDNTDIPEVALVLWWIISSNSIPFQIGLI